MRKKIILLLFVLSHTMFAQETKQDFFNFRYAGLTLEAGNTVGTGIDLNYTYKDKISLAFGCVDGYYESKNYPIGYKTDDVYEDGDYSMHFYLTVGKIIEIRRKKRFRLNLSAGLAYSKHYVNNNFVESTSNYDLYPYDYDTTTHSNMSLILNPKLEIPLLSWVGFQLSPKVVLNKTKNFYGLGFGLMFGKLYTSPLRIKAQENKLRVNQNTGEVGAEKKLSNLGLVYVSGAFELGNYFGLNAELNYIQKEKVSYSLGWMGNLYANKNPLPEDYVKDSDLLSFGPEIADSSHAYFTMGKIIKMKNFNNLRFNLAGGLAISNYNVGGNFERREQVGDGYYYDYENNHYRKVSLVLNPKLEIPFSSMVGFQVSPKVILNTQQSFYGISFGLMLGKTKNRRF